MRSYKARKGPFSAGLHYSLDEIDQICAEALRSAECLPDSPSVVRIDRFIEKRFGCDIGYEDLGQDILGCTIFTAEGRVKAVIVSTGIEDGTRSAERRLRSTLAHEAGHCLLHAHLFIRGDAQQTSFGFDDQDEPQDRILCRDAEIGGVTARQSYHGKWWEFQANRAIGGLLLPKKLVALAVEHLLIAGPVTGVATLSMQNREPAARLLAETFDVNPVVARIRLTEMWPAGDVVDGM